MSGSCRFRGNGGSNPPSPCSDRSSHGNIFRDESDSEERTVDDRQPHHDPTLWAISYEQLLDFERVAATHFGNTYHGITMRDVNREMLVEHCRQCGTCYALSVNPKGLRLDAFITHCWDEPFRDFVQCIQKHFQDAPKPQNPILLNSV